MNSPFPACRLTLAPHFWLWVTLEQAVLLWLGQDVDIAGFRFTLLEASVTLWCSAAVAHILMDTGDLPFVTPREQRFLAPVSGS